MGLNIEIVVYFNYNLYKQNFEDFYLEEVEL